MSHFYASIPTSARKTIATARGHKSTGISTNTACWDGAIETVLWFDEETQRNMYRVQQVQHMGSGISEVLAEGVVGAVYKGVK